MFNDWSLAVHIVFKLSTEGSSDKMAYVYFVIILVVSDIAINKYGDPLFKPFDNMIIVQRQRNKLSVISWREHATF